VTTKEELDQIRAQAVREMMAEDFCGTAFFLTTWGEKPSAES
jgi:hypothetical protein